MLREPTLNALGSRFLSQSPKEATPMLDHAGIPVSDLAKSKQFFAAALAPLGYKVLYDLPRATGMGTGKRSTFWIGQGFIGGPIHVAFVARDHATVDAFYGAAIAAGGRDNGKPGLRTQYHPEYYAAFVFDPDGNNIEAVCRTD
jgi:catechol 2,3-dioxygenase-like lactoylglutathione lyase family enzyme